MKPTTKVTASVAHLKSSAAKDAFVRALHLAKASAKVDVPVGEWLDKQYTVLDVEQEVIRAKERYQAKSNGRLRRWMAEFSSRVTYYGRILDMLVQHHPEYVSLVWGTTKMLFVVC